jgi:uncharacterized protein (TIGR03435 family)
VHIVAKSQTMAALAGTLSKFMVGPVHDVTGLSTVYNFTLNFEVPAGYDAPQRGPSIECTTCTPEDVTPIANIFQALGEVGLKLEPRRGPVDVLIIDHVDGTPTAN